MEHQFSEVGYCVHCGAPSWERILKWHEARGTRPDYGMEEQAKKRICPRKPSQTNKPRATNSNYVCEDWDFISGKIKELDKQNLEALNRKSE